MATSDGTALANGWGKPERSRRHHYFDNSAARCRRWSYYGSTTPAIHVPMRDRCKDCERQRRPGEI